jgi:cephalosporin hydroxylase
MIEDIMKYSDMGLSKFMHLEEIMKEAPEGVFVDVGTRMGGSALLALLQPQSSIVISVDPWGAKPYQMMHGHISNEFNDEMALGTMDLLTSKAKEINKTHIHYRMPSHDFLTLDHTLWLGGNESRLKDMKFAFILLDGDHTDEAVTKELELLEGRMIEGGIVMIDNTDWLGLEWDETWSQGRPDMKYKTY